VPRSLIVTGSGSKIVKDLTPARAMFFAANGISLCRSEGEWGSLTNLDSKAIQTNDQHVRGGHPLHSYITVKLDKVLNGMHGPSWPKT